MENENNNTSKLLLPEFNFFKKFYAPFKILIKMHLKIASQEIKTDLKRFIMGMLFVFIGINFIAGFLVFLNVLFVLLINEFLIHSVFYSVLIVTSLDLVISIFMFVAAGSNFKKPFLEETKRVFEETLKDLK